MPAEPGPNVLDPSNILFSLFFGTAQYHITSW